MHREITKWLHIFYNLQPFGSVDWTRILRGLGTRQQHMGGASSHILTNNNTFCCRTVTSFVVCCVSQRQMSTLETINFNNRALRSLPIDKEDKNYVRTVQGKVLLGHVGCTVLIFYRLASNLATKLVCCASFPPKPTGFM